MDFLSKLFDSQSLVTCAVPGLLLVVTCLLPLLAVYELSAIIKIKERVSPYLLLGVLVLTVFLLSSFIQNQGESLQGRLFEKWGGMPSMVVFRYSDRRIDPITKEHYHRFMARRHGESVDESYEREKPAEADRVYLSWSNYLRTNTRDTGVPAFALVQKASVDYSFRRNLMAITPVGIGVSSASLLFSIGLLVRRYVRKTVARCNYICACTLSAVALLLWSFCLSNEWVKIAADTYATRLIESIDSVESSLRAK